VTVSGCGFDLRGSHGSQLTILGRLALDFFSGPLPLNGFNLYAPRGLHASMVY